MRRLAHVLFCSLTALFVLPGPPADAAGEPKIGDTQAVDAPTGKKGGLLTPYVACASYDNEPRVRTVIEGVGNGFRDVYEYRGTYPGYGFPRVTVGRYEVTTTARCGSTKATRVETVRVREKSAKRTVSRAEFSRIKRGMTRARVKKIIGYDGRGSRYAGEMTRTYDMMPFWQIALVVFRDDRVVKKHWRVGHD